MTGTLSEDDAVTLYRSGQAVTTSGSLTIHGTVVAVSITNGQILVDNIEHSGTVPMGTVPYIVAQSADLWRVDAGNYFTVSGTGDDLGASPIAVAKIDSTWSAADTTAVDIDGWTTDHDNYIKIYTTTDARHRGKWDDALYRLDPGAVDDAIDVQENYVTIEGLQLRCDHNSRECISINDSAEARIDIKVSHNLMTGTWLARGVQIPNGDTSTTASIWNNMGLTILVLRLQMAMRYLSIILQVHILEVYSLAEQDLIYHIMIRVLPERMQ